MPDFPLTYIVRHPRESRRKCSVIPLEGRPDLVFLSFPVTKRPYLGNYVRLAAEGPELSAEDASKGLLILDGSWRWAEKMNIAFQEVPARSLVRYQTAYPRVSKQGTDPANGLATVEALFLGYRILGRDTDGLLDHYRWKEEFLKRNGFPNKKGEDTCPLPLRNTISTFRPSGHG